MNTTKRLEHITNLLRARGNRLTPQRLAILHALIESEKHPTAEQVFREIRKSFPTTSLATVYKTITLLKEVDEILELGFGDDPSRFDARRPHPHPHMICTGCGAIVDSDIDNFENIVDTLSQDTGFSIHSHRFDIFGLCANCQKS